MNMHKELILPLTGLLQLLQSRMMKIKRRRNQN